MTETYCHNCGETVSITHSDEDCPAGNADIRTPPHLRAHRAEQYEQSGERGR